MKQVGRKGNPIDFSARKVIAGLRRDFCGEKYRLSACVYGLKCMECNKKLRSI